MEIDSTYSHKRSLFSGGVVISYKAQGALKTGALSEIIYRLTTSLFLHELPKSLIDVAGVNDDLLIIEGLSGFQGDRKEHYRVALKTRFLETTKDHHLISTFRKESSGEIPDLISLSEIGTAIPLSPSICNLLLKFYKPKRFIGILGFMPTEIGEVRFQATSNRFLVDLRHTFSGNQKLPLKEIYIDQHAMSVFDSLKKAIDSATGIDIERDITQFF